MSQQLRTELHKLAAEQIKVLRKEAAEARTRDLTKGDLIKFMLAYGGGGALLGAGLGAASGGSDDVGSIAAGGATGALGGSLLGLIALNERKNREHATAATQQAPYEALNQALGGTWEGVPTLGGVGAAVGAALPTTVKGLQLAAAKAPLLKKLKIPKLSSLFKGPNLKPGNLGMSPTAGKYTKGVKVKKGPSWKGNVRNTALGALAGLIVSGGGRMLYNQNKARKASERVGKELPK